MKFLRLIGAEPVVVAAIIAIGAIAAYTERLQSKLAYAENEITALQFDAVNSAALHDSVTTQLRDSLRISSKLVLQAKPKADTALVGNIVAHITPLDTVIEADLPTALPDTAARQYRFTVEQYPFYGHAAVKVAGAGDHAQLGLQIAVAPARLRAAVTCIGGDKIGVKSARLAVQGPPWLQIDSLDVRQDPVVCNAPVLFTKHKRGRKVPLWALAPAVVAGYLLAPKGR